MQAASWRLVQDLICNEVQYGLVPCALPTLGVCMQHVAYSRIAFVLQGESPAMSNSKQPPNNMPPGRRVKWLRDRDGLTQADLAEIVHVDTNVISKLENLRGVPRDLNRIRDIANHFGVPWESLIEPSPDERPISLRRKA